MNLRVFWSSAFILLFVNLSLARAGKCRGRWAIHACAGGNGKRSGPLYPPDDDSEPSSRQKLENLIQQLKVQIQPHQQISLPAHDVDSDESTPNDIDDLWGRLLTKMRDQDLSA